MPVEMWQVDHYGLFCDSFPVKWDAVQTEGRELSLVRALVDGNPQPPIGGERLAATVIRPEA